MLDLENLMKHPYPNYRPEINISKKIAFAIYNNHLRTVVLSAARTVDLLFTTTTPKNTAQKN